MKKIFANVLFILTLTMISFGQGGDILQQNFAPSSILKPTLKVRAARDLNYWKQPALKNFWSWMPQLQFSAAGPIDDASYFTYEFFTPDGKLWYSLDSAPFSIEVGRIQTFESEAVKSWTDKRSTIATGIFSFKITLKNSLQGTAKTLYQGKFKVNKEFAGTPHPDFKNQYVFYVEQDWALPFAFINLNSRIDADAPVLQVAMWFRGDVNSSLQGFLFYNGKQVSNTEGGGIGQAQYIISEGDDKNKFRWEQATLSFINVRYFDNKGGYDNRHILKNKPGNYEVKVLLDGELVRTAAFTIGTDGKIVDNGVAKSNSLSGFGVVVPAKVSPVKEGSLDLLSYKTDAFYGNPLTGFSVQ